MENRNHAPLTLAEMVRALDRPVAPTARVVQERRNDGGSSVLDRQPGLSSIVRSLSRLREGCARVTS